MCKYCLKDFVEEFLGLLAKPDKLGNGHYTIIICDKKSMYGFYFVSCMNVIFNELRQ